MKNESLYLLLGSMLDKAIIVALNNLLCGRSGDKGSHLSCSLFIILEPARREGPRHKGSGFLFCVCASQLGPHCKRH